MSNGIVNDSDREGALTTGSKQHVLATNGRDGEKIIRTGAGGREPGAGIGSAKIPLIGLRINVWGYLVDYPKTAIFGLERLFRAPFAGKSG